MAFDITPVFNGITSSVHVLFKSIRDLIFNMTSPTIAELVLILVSLAVAWWFYKFIALKSRILIITILTIFIYLFLRLA